MREHTADRRIVAVALVTEAELKLLGEGFDRAFPIDDTPCFRDLLSAIDDADRDFRRKGEANQLEPSSRDS